MHLSMRAELGSMQKAIIRREQDGISTVDVINPAPLFMLKVSRTPRPLFNIVDAS